MSNAERERRYNERINSAYDRYLRKEITIIEMAREVKRANLTLIEGGKCKEKGRDT